MTRNLFSADSLAVKGELGVGTASCLIEDVGNISLTPLEQNPTLEDVSLSGTK